MLFRDIKKDVSLDSRFRAMINPDATAIQFYQYFVSRFVEAQLRDGDLFCGECGAILELCGRPIVGLRDVPVMLTVTMTLSCDCSIDDDGVDEDSRGYDAPW